MPEPLTPRLENLLEQCQSSPYFLNRPPLILESRIAKGTVNQCWKLRSGEDLYLARLSQDLPDNFLTHWQNELAINQFSAGRGLAPDAVYTDSSGLAAVYSWAGEPLSRKSLDELQIKALGQQLSLLHESSAPAPTIGYRQTILNYLKIIDEKTGHREFRDECKDILDLADCWDQSPERCFCHHDLNPGNVLWNGTRLLFIDWEYARYAHPLFDLASLSCYLQLSDSEMNCLLENYSARNYRLSQIRASELMVKGLGKLWHRAAEIVLKS